MEKAQAGDLEAQWGETDDPAGPLDQDDSEQVLQLAKARGQGRLGDEAGLRGLAEMAMLTKGDEILQLLDGRQVNCHR